MIPELLFSLSLLFAAFVSWFCFQWAAKERNSATLYTLASNLIGVSLAYRVHEDAKEEAEYALANYNAMEFSVYRTALRRYHRIRVATVTMLKLKNIRAV